MISEKFRTDFGCDFIMPPIQTKGDFMKKEFVSIMLAGFALTGCASLQAQRLAEENQINSYWENPENKVLLTVANIDDFYGYVSMDCTISTGEYGQNNNSFETSGPLIRVIDVSKHISEFKNQYNRANQFEREQIISQIELMGPAMTAVCQSGGSGIEAIAYFDGKEIARSTASQYMGVVSISIDPPIAEKISEGGVG